MQKFDQLVKKVNDLAADAIKTDLGNKSAATRLRAGMQEVRKLAMDIRSDALVATKSVNP